jgi:hypothetical protein
MKSKNDFDPNMRRLGLVFQIQEHDDYHMIIVDQAAKDPMDLFAGGPPDFLGVPVKPLKETDAASGDVVWYGEGDRIFVSGGFDGQDMIEIQPHVKAWSR